MTVKELIKQLELLPQDLLVETEGCDCYGDCNGPCSGAELIEIKGQDSFVLLKRDQ